MNKYNFQNTSIIRMLLCAGLLSPDLLLHVVVHGVNIETNIIDAVDHTVDATRHFKLTESFKFAFKKNNKCYRVAGLKKNIMLSLLYCIFLSSSSSFLSTGETSINQHDDVSHK